MYVDVAAQNTILFDRLLSGSLLDLECP